MYINNFSHHKQNNKLSPSPNATQKYDKIVHNAGQPSQQSTKSTVNQINREAVKDEAVKDEAVKDEAVKDEAVKDEAVKDEAVKDEAVKDEAVKDEAVKDEAVKDEAVITSIHLFSSMTLRLTFSAPSGGSLMNLNSLGSGDSLRSAAENHKLLSTDAGIWKYYR